MIILDHSITKVVLDKVKNIMNINIVKPIRNVLHSSKIYVSKNCLLIGHILDEEISDIVVDIIGTCKVKWYSQV